MTGDHNQMNSIFVDATPYTILDSTRSKCFSVIAPHNQIISIQYEAPGTFEVFDLALFCAILESIHESISSFFLSLFLL